VIPKYLRVQLAIRGFGDAHYLYIVVSTPNRENHHTTTSLLAFQISLNEFTITIYIAQNYNQNFKSGNQEFQVKVSFHYHDYSLRNQTSK
jgi:ABC-type sulfate transport system permease component